MAGVISCSYLLDLITELRFFSLGTAAIVSDLRDAASCFFIYLGHTTNHHQVRYQTEQIRLLELSSVPFRPYFWQSQDLMLRSTVSFLIVTYSGTFLSLNHLSNCFFPCPLLFLAIYALRAGYLFVTDTLSTSTITEPPSVKCQHLLIPTRSSACVARIDLGLKSNPND